MNSTGNKRLSISYCLIVLLAVCNLAASYAEEQVVPSRAVVEKTYKLKDATVAQIADSKGIVGFLWGADGKSFYVYTYKSIRKISYPEFKLQAEVELNFDDNFAGVMQNKPYYTMGQSKDHIVVVAPRFGGVGVFDKKTLTKTASVKIENAFRITSIASSSDVDFALVSVGSDPLNLIDCKTGKIIKTYSVGDVAGKDAKLKMRVGSKKLSSFKVVQLTPDGKYIVVADNECLHLLSLKNFDIEYLQASQRIYSLINMSMSQDGMYVFTDSDIREDYLFNHEGYPPFKDCGIYVWKTTNLYAPVALLTGKFDRGVWITNWQVDKNRKVIYSPKQSDLWVLNLDGTPLRSYDLIGENAEKVLVSPTGKALLVQADYRLDVLSFE